MESVIEVATNEIGYCDQSGESKYFKELFPDARPMPWCLAFIIWIFAKAYGKGKAEEMLFMAESGLTYSVPAMVNLVKQKNKWHYKKGAVGWLLFLRLNYEWTNHVELIADVDDKTITTIGGNCGGKVQKNIYQRDDKRISGFGEVMYENIDL